MDSTEFLLLLDVRMKKQDVFLFFLFMVIDHEPLDRCVQFSRTSVFSFLAVKAIHFEEVIQENEWQNKCLYSSLFSPQKL